MTILSADLDYPNSQDLLAKEVILKLKNQAYISFVTTIGCRVPPNIT